jgi:hypothetical protein
MGWMPSDEGLSQWRCFERKLLTSTTVHLGACQFGDLFASLRYQYIDILMQLPTYQYDILDVSTAQ